MVKYTSLLLSFSSASTVGSFPISFKPSEIKWQSYPSLFQSPIWLSIEYLFTSFFASFGFSSSFWYYFIISQLKILQNHHVRICRSVELLNDSFGTILLLEMFFIFTCFTNYLIKILVIFPTASTYNKIAMITLLFGITGNLAMICNSAELIRSKV